MNSTSTFPYGLKYGLISATISLAILFGLYIANPELVFSAWQVSLIGLVALVVLMAMAGLEFRRDNGDSATYGQAFSCAFFVFAVSYLFAFLGQYVLMNFIDPSLATLQMEMSIEGTISVLESFGADEATIEDAIAEIEKQGGKQTIGQLTLAYLMFLIPGAILAAIIAIFTKKNRPFDYSDALN